MFQCQACHAWPLPSRCPMKNGRSSCNGRGAAAQRTAGIEKDAPGRGRPATVQHGAVEAEVIRKTTRERPPTATHWSTRTLAAELCISPASVRRIWKRHGLKPHLVRTSSSATTHTSRRSLTISWASISTRRPTRWSSRSMRRVRSRRSTARSPGCRSRRGGQAR